MIVTRVKPFLLTPPNARVLEGPKFKIEQLQQQRTMETPLAPLPVDESIGSQRSTTTTVLVVPRGPDWIVRQTHAELRSLEGWNIPPEKLDDWLVRWKVTKRFLLAVMLLTLMLVLFSFENYNTTAWYVCAAILLVAGVLGIAAYCFVSGYLKRVFSESFLTSMDPGDKSRQPIRVTFQNYMSWASRQTPDEILSVQGWTEDDLAVLMPLLSRKTIVEYCRHLFEVLFIAVLWLPILLLSTAVSGEEGEYEARLWLFFTQMLVIVAYTVFVCWSIQLKGRVEQLFLRRFVQQPRSVV